MTLSITRVEMLDLDYIDLQWTFTPTKHDALAYEIFVERGESPEGPFDVVAGPLRDTYQLSDYIAPRRRAWRTLHYRIRVTGPDGEHISPPATSNPRPALEAMEMIRLYDKLLREYVGRPCIVMPIRTFGTRCASCFDAVTQRRTQSRCAQCYNTGFARGYHRPMVAYVQIDPSELSQTNTSELVSEQAATRGRMGVYPLLKPRDVLVEREGTRWRVASVSRTERLRAPVHQEITLTRIPEGDIEYRIPVRFPEDERVSPRSFSFKEDI